MSSMVQALEQAIKVEESKPRKRKTAAEKADVERRRFCNIARKMLEQVNKKNQRIDSLLSNQQEAQILTGVKSSSDFAKHKQVLETLRLILLETKVAFNCGD